MTNPSFQPLLHQLRQVQPLVLNLTNLVTMDFIANGLLALGASPIMSQAKEEMEDLVKLSAAVVINLGTLNDEFLSLVKPACEFANQFHKPLILDPVGAGATSYRTQAALNLLSTYSVQIIRANASEIAALHQNSKQTKGVDSTMKTHEVIDAAHTIAEKFNTILCISGETDLIVSDTQLEQNHHGSRLMTQVTGTGCLLSAVVAAFHAIEADAFTATAAATTYYGLCGEQAAEKSSGPGSFRTHFINALNHLYLQHGMSENESNHRSKE